MSPLGFCFTYFTTKKGKLFVIFISRKWVKVNRLFFYCFENWFFVLMKFNKDVLMFKRNSFQGRKIQILRHQNRYESTTWLIGARDFIQYSILSKWSFYRKLSTAFRQSQWTEHFSTYPRWVPCFCLLLFAMDTYCISALSNITNSINYVLTSFNLNATWTDNFFEIKATIFYQWRSIKPQKTMENHDKQLTWCTLYNVYTSILFSRKRLQ